jgi:Fur family ferric uptake transcriptional regulator
MATTPESLLNHAGLRRTRSREAVLALFLQKPIALAHGDLESALPAYDRVTLYRTLNTFLEHGLLHKVVDDGALVKYAISHTAKGAEIAHHHAHHHVHFKCSLCQTTQCLEQVTLPSVVLPEGYTVQEENLLLVGICPRCS